MARPTQQEIEEWEARMNEPEETDSDDFEVVLFDEQGNPVGTMPFHKAKVYFAKRGIDLDEPASANANAGNAPNSANANGGRQDTAGSQLPPSTPRARPTSRYFGKSGGSAATVDPNNLPAGSQPI